MDRSLSENEYVVHLILWLLLLRKFVYCFELFDEKNYELLVVCIIVCIVVSYIGGWNNGDDFSRVA